MRVRDSWCGYFIYESAGKFVVTDNRKNPISSGIPSMEEAHSIIIQMIRREKEAARQRRKQQRRTQEEKEAA